MEEQITEEKPKRRWVTTIAGGCLVVLFLGFFIIVAIFIQRQAMVRNSPTPAPTMTPIPHVLVRQPANSGAIKHEGFSSNSLDWGLYYQYGKLEVINGKLILQSNIQGAYIIGTSEKFFPSGKTYYIQADFTTDTDQIYPYGLIFGLNKSLGTYYAFEIQPRIESFRLLKSNNGKWRELVPYSRHVTSPYPEATTLSVYFDEGNIELYINGELVSTFLDIDFFQSKEIGIFVSNSGYRLIVDDFFIYDKK